MEQEKNRVVYKVFKKTGYRIKVQDRLTRDEAKRMVQRDQEENPKATKYMMVFDKM